MAHLPESIAGFIALPINYSLSSTHVLYARPHSGSKKVIDKALPNGRTLFLVNVPPDATEREMSLMFKKAGTVEKVIFDTDPREPAAEDSESESDENDAAPAEAPGAADGEKPRKRRKVSKAEAVPTVVALPSKPVRTIRRTGMAAHVVFLDESSLARALAPPHKPRPWPTASDEPRGLAHYAALHDALRPPLDAVQAHADSYMEVYEYELAKGKQKSKYRKGEAIVDEDGFTLVTRGGAYGKTLGGGVAVASKRFQATGQSKRNRPKKESKEKEGFYAFQKAEKQRQDLINLRKNWEADKAKVEKLKQSRRFKPY